MFNNIRKSITEKSAVFAKASSLAGVTALLMGASAISHAEPTGYNQITFSADAKAQVENDELNASMYKKVQAKEPKMLATELTTALNKAMRVAKRYPSVEVSTGSQHTYPRYDKQNNITGWTGQVGVEIKSTDIEAASRLIADLQPILVMENLSFGVSEKKREIIERRLMTEASKAFQNQANNVASAWNATGYRVVAVSLNSNGNHYPRPVALSSMTRSAEMSAPMDFESGNTTLTITANGTIELAPMMVH